MDVGAASTNESSQSSGHLQLAIGLSLERGLG
jgi:hypothetical protein